MGGLGQDRAENRGQGALRGGCLLSAPTSPQSPYLGVGKGGPGL